MPRKTAICMGINEYKLAPLPGCVNDATDWAEFLSGRGFETKKLFNGDCTKIAIFNEMMTLVSGLKVGDLGVIMFAGHGTWVPDMNGDEPEGRDECLCPVDMSEKNLLIDDEISEIWTHLTPGARVVFITDACHSGTVFRYAPDFSDGEEKRLAVRYLPPGNFVTTREAETNIKLAQQFAPQSLGQQPIGGLIHFAACANNELACDGILNGKANGAFSRTALSILNGGFTGTYGELIKEIRTKLPDWRYPQTPVLNSNTVDRDASAFC